jgi:hypothetical protein
MAQIEIKEKELKALMAEGLLVKEIAERLGVKVGGVKAAAKAFGLNLREKPTTRTPKYVFIKDEADNAETSQEVVANVTEVQPKTKKVKEVKVEEVSIETTTSEESNSFVNTLLGKGEASVDEPATEKKESNDDFGF